MPRTPSRTPVPRSSAGGRHELGQNFLRHRPTIRRITDLVAETAGPILELGAGDGALTRALAHLGRPLTAVEIDEHRVRQLRRTVPDVRIEHADATRVALDAPVVAGNIPFHLTTPVLRRLLGAGRWQHAVLLTQWEVARKRAGVGGGTLLTATSMPWFAFTLEFRVPAAHFVPRPSVDGGVLGIARRTRPLVPYRERRRYEVFVRGVFTGAGGSLPRVVGRAARIDHGAARRVLTRAGVPERALPRDLGAHQWAALWHAVRG